ncbi:Detected protein of confused Function [Hibiscus syriacus]|uniref:Detected protein of confused Function n=1 Tax=Hibiscus syriacus TaxID=106335 RepID=A0A6A3AF61_HIBSY|nr:Detected protein of confused Function [Hibiscus syriacus]
MANEPPFFETYKAIFQRSAVEKKKSTIVDAFEELEIPLIDLGHLNLGPFERQECIKKMARAAVEWGFFQIVNHGIPEELLTRLKQEQIKVFQQPFDKKSEDNFLNLSVQSYRWGNPLATCLRNLSWSEVLHISLNDISKMDEYNKLRKLGYQSELLQRELLADLELSSIEQIPSVSIFFHDLKRNGRWVSVKPNPETLVVNIGDFYQALSNGVYKSITHRVIANQECERYSAAYFYCPTYETVIESCSNPNLYRKFSFKEYREQIQKDVKLLGTK